MLYPDADRDGHGAATGVATPHCSDTAGFSPDNTDCDDTNLPP